MTKDNALTIIIDSTCTGDFAGGQETINLEEALFESLGLKQPYPYADFYLNNGASMQGESKFCVAPLSLAAGMHDILIQAMPEHLEITQAELEEIIFLIQPLVSELGFNFIEQAKGLFIEGNFDVSTTPYFKLGTSSIKSCMPKGKNKDLFNRLMAECQMVLSQADFNQERTANGQFPINSLWFWGEGEWHFQNKAISLLTDCDYIKNKVILEKSITLISKAEFLNSKKNQMAENLVIYLTKVDSAIEKKLNHMNKFCAINRVWHNTSYQKTKQSVLSRLKKFMRL